MKTLLRICGVTILASTVGVLSAYGQHSGKGSSKDKEGKKIKADPEKVKEFRKSLTSLADIYISTSSYSMVVDCR